MFQLNMFWGISSLVHASNFLKQTLFRWCHDIGREQAANKPLLKTVFQVPLSANNCSESQYPWLLILWCYVLQLYAAVFQVMMRLFSPRKTTLMFVIRDKTRVCFLPLYLVLCYSWGMARYCIFVCLSEVWSWAGLSVKFFFVYRHH